MKGIGRKFEKQNMKLERRMGNMTLNASESLTNKRECKIPCEGTRER